MIDRRHVFFAQAFEKAYGRGARERDAALHAAGGVEEDRRGEGGLFDGEKTDLLLAPVLEDFEVWARELVYVAPALVRHGDVQDHEVSFDSDYIFVRLLLLCPDGLGAEEQKCQ